MLQALNQFDELVYPPFFKDKSAKYFCPCCRAEVIHKAGSKKISHFAHIAETNCEWDKIEAEQIKHNNLLKLYSDNLPGFTEEQYKYYMENIVVKEKRIEQYFYLLNLILKINPAEKYKGIYEKMLKNICSKGFIWSSQASNLSKSIYFSKIEDVDYQKIPVKLLEEHKYGSESWKYTKFKIV